MEINGNMSKPEVVAVSGPGVGGRMLSALNHIKEKRNGDFNIKTVSSDSFTYIAVKENAIFRAVPEGKLAEVFSSILDLKTGPDVEPFRNALSVLTSPVRIKLYITAFCPHCGSVMNELIPLVSLNSNITLEIIDGALFSELAEKDMIKAAPTAIFDNRFRWTAGFKREEFVETISAVNPKDLSVTAQKKMVESGEASYLADMMIHAQTVFPSFYELLTDEKWPIRLGAMVAAERIAENNRTLAAHILESLWSLYEKVAEPVKGDIIYLTGETGTMSHVRKLELISELSTSHDLAEAALEAVEHIVERCKDE